MTLTSSRGLCFVLVIHRPRRTSQLVQILQRMISARAAGAPVTLHLNASHTLIVWCLTTFPELGGRAAAARTWDVLRACRPLIGGSSPPALRARNSGQSRWSSLTARIGFPSEP